MFALDSLIAGMPPLHYHENEPDETTGAGRPQKKRLKIYWPGNSTIYLINILLEHRHLMVLVTPGDDHQVCTFDLDFDFIYLILFLFVYTITVIHVLRLPDLSEPSFSNCGSLAPSTVQYFLIRSTVTRDATFDPIPRNQLASLKPSVTRVLAYGTYYTRGCFAADPLLA